jgi:hypothetical protein
LEGDGCGLFHGIIPALLEILRTTAKNLSSIAVNLTKIGTEYVPNISKECYYVTNLLGKGKFVPLLFLTEHHAMKAYWGSRSIAPCILDLGSRWR